METTSRLPSATSSSSGKSCRKALQKVTLSKAVIFLTAILQVAAAAAAASAEPANNSVSDASATSDGAIAHKMLSQGVQGVIGYAAEIPCEVTPLTPQDSPVLILWYRDIFGTPIYSFDMRSEPSGRHWMERKSLGNRASFHLENTGQQTDEGVDILRAFLRIEKLRKSDEGPYRCRVDFRQAPTRNVKIKLQLIELPSKPEIQTENGTLVSEEQSPPRKINSTLVLTCKTQGGLPTPDLTWWRENFLEPRRQLIGHQTVEGGGGGGSIRVKSVLRLEGLGRADLGARIGCSANNTDLLEPMQTSLKINMLLPPIRAKIVREWSYFMAGRPYNVSCQVLGSHPSADTKAWIGERQLKIADLQIHPEGDVTTTRFTFLPSVVDNGRFLVCRAENPHLRVNNAVEDQWKIEVQYVPRTELVLSEYRASKVEVNEGELVELKCLVNANPPAHTVHWRKNGNAINLLESSSSSFESPLTDPSPAAEGDVQQQPVPVAAAAATLSFRSVTAQVRGKYSCVAENLLGLGESNALEVQVKYRPVCVRSGELLWFVGLGELVELPCKVDAFPQESLNFTWTMEQQQQKKKKIQQQDGSFGAVSKIENHVNLQTSSLFFSPASSQDYGKLYCEASNEAGKQGRPCVFQIKPKGLPEIAGCDVQSSGLDWIRVRCQLRSTLPLEALHEEEWQLQTKLRVSAVLKVAAPLLPAERAIAAAAAAAAAAANDSASLNASGEGQVTVSGLSPGSRYRLLVSVWNPRRVPAESEKPLELEADTLQQQRQQQKEKMVVDVEATTTAGAFIPSNDTIRLLPIIGILSVIVVILVLVAVVIVVVMRCRNIDGIDPNLKTHVGFNRSVDFDIEPDIKKQPAMDREILKNLETISKLDSYQHLNDVQFEGFSSIERSSSGRGDNKATISIPPKTNTSNKNRSSKQHSLLESDLDFALLSSPSASSASAAKAAACEVFVHDRPKSEVPVGSLCIIDDGEKIRESADFAPKATGYSYLQKTPSRSENEVEDEDFFPFREAVSAPTPVRRLSHLTSDQLSSLLTPGNEDVLANASKSALEQIGSSAISKRDQSWSSAATAAAAAASSNSSSSHPRVTFAVDDSVRE